MKRIRSGVAVARGQDRMGVAVEFLVFLQVLGCWAEEVRPIPGVVHAVQHRPPPEHIEKLGPKGQRDAIIFNRHE